MTSLSLYIKTVEQGSVLSEEDMIDAMKIIMNGSATEPELEQFLILLNDRGEAVSEITGAAKVMRNMASTITAPKGAIDCCGTGGDASGTYNISTAVAIVAAACGVPIAKHGNRAASSKSGAADVLEALGVNLDISNTQLESALQQFNFCFLMATNHHGAMKHVVPTRKKLGRRTIFNLLGPLANPAGTKNQLIGVFDRKWLKPMAETLHNLGTEKAWIVHGTDGLDEITTTAETNTVILENGKITERTLSPDDFGVTTADPSDLKGGGATENAAALMEVLNGAHNAYRDIVLVNTSAVLNIHGTASNLKEGVKIASDIIDSGKALETLQNYAAFTQGQPS
ncbi:MAG: anthranilate phosphoribosyltransferase [Micavibrio sp.]|nr:anthranilate phosphoribosyltransferase [Micavibrio sp.]